MECPPSPAMCIAMRRQNLAWRELLGELVDNSLDAQATRITITLGPGTHVRVSDDGIGCNDLEKMVTIGLHYRTPGTKLGCFGVGLKDVGCALWGTTVITTLADGKQRQCRINWPALSKSATWHVADPVDMAPTMERGMVIEFQKSSKRLPTKLDQLAVDLGFIFAPALRKGKQIAIHKGKRVILCKPYRLPPLEDVVEEQFSVGSRSVRLRVGVVVEGEGNDRPGFTFCHEHRVIENSGLGASSYSVERIAGEVELDSRWPLSKNKTRIVDGRDELAAAISVRCKGLFEKAKMRTRNLAIENLGETASQLLSRIVSPSKEKREKRGETTTGKPSAKTGRTRTRAARTQPGKRVLKEMTGGVDILWIHIVDGPLGRVDLSPTRIELNTANPFIENIRDENNILAISQVALTLLTCEVYNQHEASKFPWCRDYSGITEALGALLPQLVGESDTMRKAEPAQ